MRNICERDRIGRFGKRELEVEHRRLQKKLRKVDDYDLYDDDDIVKVIQVMMITT